MENGGIATSLSIGSLSSTSIMNSGGFDVIIGNPPYVEYRDVKNKYAVAGYETLSCGNLYAFVLERNTTLTVSRSRSVWE